MKLDEVTEKAITRLTYGELSRISQETGHVPKSKLTSLQGAPVEEIDMLDVSNNCLVSLKYCPKHVKKSFDCSYNLIKSLEYAPTVGLDFNARENPITSLSGAPTVIPRNFDVSHCTNLRTLEGGPSKVERNYFAIGCDLVNLDGIASFIGGELDICGNERLTSLKNIHKKIKRLEALRFSPRLIKSHVLGLFLIDRFKVLTAIKPPLRFKDDLGWYDILNQYLHKRENNKKFNMYDCQQALIDAGFEEYAKI